MSRTQKASFRSSRAAAKAACGHNGFVPITRELLMSDAWRTLSVHGSRVLSFLCLQHLKAAGTDNGFLTAPYDALVAYGVGRRFISGAFKELIERGLIEVMHRGGLSQGRVKQPNNSLYRLTFLHERLNGATGPEWTKPTHDWKDFNLKARNGHAKRNGKSLKEARPGARPLSKGAHIYLWPIKRRKQMDCI